MRITGNLADSGHRCRCVGCRGRLRPSDIGSVAAQSCCTFGILTFECQQLGLLRDRDVGGIWHGGAMTSGPRHISEWIDRPADEVYDYASDPGNLPQWAPGLGSSVEKVGERWFVETSMGRVGFTFVQRNEYGVLDHDVTLPPHRPGSG